MSEFIVAIPSYRRASAQDTVNYLTDLNFPKERTYVFVQTEEDRKAYEQTISDRANVVYAEASNVSQARNNILRYFRHGGTALKEDVVMFDDDLKCIGKLENGRIRGIYDGKEFEKIIASCFSGCRKYGGRIFGVYTPYNEFYMSKSISTRCLINTVIGCPKGFSMLFDESYIAKEDIELCARIMRNGGKVIRYDFLSVDAKHKTNAGGCHEDWHSGIHAGIADRLCVMYPELFAHKKDNPQEVRLKIKRGKLNDY